MSGISCSIEMRSASPVESWCVVLDPRINGRMIVMQTPFMHYLFQIAIAQRIAQIPAHTQQNNLGLEMAPFERDGGVPAAGSSCSSE